MPENVIELEEFESGNKVTVPVAHWLRYPQLKGLPMVIGGARRVEDELIARLNQDGPARPDGGPWSEAHLAEIPVAMFPRLAD